MEDKIAEREQARKSSDATFKQWQINQKIRQAQINRGSQYPPFNIEPMPHERNRLSKLMTPEERAARRQWVMDQKLAPNEPRNINRIAPDQYPHDVKPKNILRRFQRAPMNWLYKAVLKPVLGETVALYTRRIAPKFVLGYFATLYFYYYVKYNKNTWENCYGTSQYWAKRDVIGETPPPAPPSDYFNNRGFKERKSLLEFKTSRNSELSHLANEPY